MTTDRGAELALYNTGMNSNLAGACCAVLAIASIRADYPVHGLGIALTADQMDEFSASFAAALPGTGIYSKWVKPITADVAETVSLRFAGCDAFIIFAPL
jgi:hypothetical protein